MKKVLCLLIVASLCFISVASANAQNRYTFADDKNDLQIIETNADVENDTTVSEDSADI